MKCFSKFTLTWLLLTSACIVARADLLGGPTSPSDGPALGGPLHGPGDPIIGLPPDTASGNCFPFGCPYSGLYQQVYDHSQFSEAITISDLEFFNTQFNNGTTTTPTGTFTVDLSYTNATDSTLSSNFASNIGAGETQVFSGSLSQPWAFGDTLTINLTSMFTYDPALGNLLMTVSTSSTAVSASLFFDVNSTDNAMGRVFCLSGINCGANGTVQKDFGLVTGFSTVPEPSSVILLGTLVLGVSAREAKRRKQKKG